MAALWAIGGISIYVDDDSDWIKSEHIAEHYPLGSNFATVHYSCSSQTRSVRANVTQAQFDSLQALTGATGLSFTGPSTGSGMVVLKNMRPQRFQNANLDGVLGPLRKVTLELVRIG